MVTYAKRDSACAGAARAINPSINRPKRITVSLFGNKKLALNGIPAQPPAARRRGACSGEDMTVWCTATVKPAGTNPVMATYRRRFEKPGDSYEQRENR